MKYTKGWAYRVEGGGFAYRLHEKYTVTKDYHCLYFSIVRDRWGDLWLIIRQSYCWDGATKFFDFPWIMAPSAIHDALHQAIHAGVIPENENDLIDSELEHAIEGNRGKRWALKVRGFYCRRATNWVNEKAGSEIAPIELPLLKNERSIEHYEKHYANIVVGGV